MILSVLADDVAAVADDDSSVPDGLPVGLVSFEDWGDDHHIVLLS